VRLLLDTQVVLWQLGSTRSIAPDATETIQQASELLFSVVSFAEIGVKSAIDKLNVPGELREHIEQSGIRVLGLAPDHGLGVATLPMHHRDPFDRLLISQALHERLAIVTADSRFADYEITVIQA
jgi:PIN domain nuclease of toxin-antitoxin system